MAGTSTLIDKYRDLLQNLLPFGRLWTPAEQPNFRAFLTTIATELCRVDGRARDLLKEADPRITSELLSDWENLLGLPDECSPKNQTDDERRAQVVQKYANVGGLSASFYEELILNLGFVVTVENRLNFIVGRGRAGDALYNYFNETLEAGEEIGPLKVVGWRYVFNVEMPASSVEVLEAGEEIGVPLVQFTNELVRCTMQKLKLAHSQVTFTFV